MRFSARSAEKRIQSKNKALLCRRQKNADRVRLVIYKSYAPQRSNLRRRWLAQSKRPW
jgi:hypothetical protein